MIRVVGMMMRMMIVAVEPFNIKVYREFSTIHLNRVRSKQIAKPLVIWTLMTEYTDPIHRIFVVSIHVMTGSVCLAMSETIRGSLSTAGQKGYPLGE